MYTKKEKLIITVFIGRLSHTGKRKKKKEIVAWRGQILLRGMPETSQQGQRKVYLSKLATLPESYFHIIASIFFFPLKSSLNFKCQHRPDFKIT